MLDALDRIPSGEVRLMLEGASDSNSRQMAGQAMATYAAIHFQGKEFFDLMGKWIADPNPPQQTPVAPPPPVNDVDPEAFFREGMRLLS